MDIGTAGLYPPPTFSLLLPPACETVLLTSWTWSGIIILLIYPCDSNVDMHVFCRSKAAN